MHPISGDALADFFAGLLRVPRESISTTTHVLELGADSIMLLEARTWIETRYGHRIEIRRFFEDLNTIDAIAAFLAAESPQRTDAGDGVPVPGEDVRDALSPIAGRADPASGEMHLMHAQLALVADVIEAQNRTIAALRRRAEAIPASRARLAETNIQETEVTAA